MVARSTEQKVTCLRVMTDTYRTFAEQTQHYFDRPHSELPTAPITGDAAWRSADLKQTPERWQYQLTDSDIGEILAAVDQVKHLNLGQIDKSNFPLPRLTARIREWRNAIMNEAGLMLIRGLPVADWDINTIERAYWGIGHHLGVPGGQNPDNELLGHVKDYGEAKDDPFIRLYRTTANIRYHCDAADIVGLLCLHPARSGGQSRIVSTVTLFNELLKVHPDLAPRLFKPFRLDGRGERKPGQKPYSMITPCRYHHGELRTFYHSDYYRSIGRHQGVELTKEEAAILNFYDETGLRPDLYLDMDLQPGDIQFISNHVIAHARTEYVDFEEAEKKRHLLRLWLSATLD